MCVCVPTGVSEPLIHKEETQLMTIVYTYSLCHIFVHTYRPRVTTPVQFIYTFSFPKALCVCRHFHSNHRTTFQKPRTRARVRRLRLETYARPCLVPATANLTLTVLEYSNLQRTLVNSAPRGNKEKYYSAKGQELVWNCVRRKFFFREEFV